jgi:glycosyltransferase involved in cell wall biosynthesis
VSSPDLSVVIPAWNEAGNLGLILPELKAVFERARISAEVLVVDGGSRDGTADVVRKAGARLIVQSSPGFGGALREGLAAARGRWVLTMDADMSHPPEDVQRLWEARERGDLVQASRYVPGAGFDAPWSRRVLSRILNAIFAVGLALPVRDVSGDFRIYDGKILQGLRLDGVQFEVVEEILVKVYMAGGTLAEIPFHYAQRGEGRSKARVFSFGLRLMRMFFRLWPARFLSARGARP